MRVVINNNVLKVVTSIKVADLGYEGIAERPATKDVSQYKVFPDNNGTLSKFGMGYNTIEEGCVGVTIILPIGVEDGDYKKFVKNAFGTALRAALATDEIAAKLAADNAELEAILGTEETTAPTEA